MYGRLGDAGAQEALLERRLSSDSGTIEPAELADASYQLAELRLRRGGATAEALELLERALSIDPQPERAAILLRPRRSRRAPIRRAPVERSRTWRAAPATTGCSSTRSSPCRPPRRARAPRPITCAKQPRRLAGSPTRPSSSGCSDQRRGLATTLGDGAVDWALIELARRREREGELVASADLFERAARVADGDARRELLLHVASSAAGRLGDQRSGPRPWLDLDRAARLYEELRRDESGDRAIWGPLVDVYRRTGDRTRLAALLDGDHPARQGRASRSAAAFASNERASPWARTMTRPRRCSRSCSDDDPSQVEAATMLAELFEKLGRREEPSPSSCAPRLLDAAKDREDRGTIVRLSPRPRGAARVAMGRAGRAGRLPRSPRVGPEERGDPAPDRPREHVARRLASRSGSRSTRCSRSSRATCRPSTLALKLAKDPRRPRRRRRRGPRGSSAGWQARPGDTRLRDDLASRLRHRARRMGKARRDAREGRGAPRVTRRARRAALGRREAAPRARRRRGGRRRHPSCAPSRSTRGTARCWPPRSRR